MSTPTLAPKRRVDQDLDAPVLYDLDLMKASLASGVMCVPKGITREARRKYVREQLKNVPNG
ncbi:hypothetical protein [Pseudomonas sp. BRM28]|uniref:hypothetical protein n=1 Tax=Pseudomonas sp. BRM28 TaxID=2045201 RepID=UPI0011B00392|nr:hypothetical protein [Pseudomonas sp. BRM28]